MNARRGWESCWGKRKQREPSDGRRLHGSDAHRCFVRRKSRRSVLGMSLARAICVCRGPLCPAGAVSTSKSDRLSCRVTPVCRVWTLKRYGERVSKLVRTSLSVPSANAKGGLINPGPTRFSPSLGPFFFAFALLYVPSRRSHTEKRGEKTLCAVKPPRRCSRWGRGG